MNVSVNWLRELVPVLDEPVEALAERFTLTAAAVETRVEVGGGLDEIVVARAVDVEPHPNADRLKYCRVDPGDGELIDVVCGAPVVESGALYPYVGPGASLPGGFRIESRKIRGVVSHGMLCSEAELDLGRDKGGIMRLPDDLEPGRSLSDALGLPDVRLSLDLNPNRVDLACHLGVARELLTEPGQELAVREAGGAEWSPRWVDGETEATAGGVTVRVEDPERCRRYLGAIVRGVRVGPSPAWLTGRLLAIGARPINNVVDATNYVLFERNQPIHAFDLETLAGPEIQVRAARPAERLRTLDGEDREMSPASTVIADRDRPVALAGVMGGEDTEVSDRTVDLFVECAAFSPRHVRRTGKELGLSTEASYRFERGIDESAAESALRRCVELILATAGGEADVEAIRVGRRAPAAPEIELRRARTRQVLGIDPSVDEVRRLLVPIGFQPVADGTGEDSVTLRVPGWRGDVTREIDLIEEVARRFGYEEFPHLERRFRPSTAPDDPAWDRMGAVRALLVGRGLLEARSSTFVPRWTAGSEADVAVLNPLSAEEGFLRGAIVPVLVSRVEYNFARGRRDVRLFEIGTVFRLLSEAEATGDGRDGTERYGEELRVGAVLTGRRAPRHWSSEGEDVDVWGLKGLATEVAERLWGGVVRPGAGQRLEGSFRAGWLGAERFCILRGEEPVGVAGRVRADALETPPWAADVWALEFRLDAAQPRSRSEYAPVSAYPAVRRDLAVTVPVETSAAAVEERIREAGSELLDSVELFDVYEGQGVERGRRSLAWAFRFRALDRTLTEKEVQRAMQAITSALESDFDARVRDS